MQEKRYKLTDKGKKILKDINQYKEIGINMQEFAAELLGFDVKKGKNERR